MSSPATPGPRLPAHDSREAAASWPYAPLTTSGRWILDAAGHNITYAGINWPGAGETMIPEGLQYQSIASIASQIKNTGMNSVRLTYAIEMIDDYYSNGNKDTTILASFQKALGTANGLKIFNQVIQKNPSFSNSTTRMQVFDAVAAGLAAQQIYVHLDNHVSKAMWCCSSGDGNAWFTSSYFNVSNWVRGLGYMATRGASWPNLMSMSLRNELRSPGSNTNYNWQVWYENVVPAAKAINAANPNVLIFLSGLNFDTDMSPIPLAGDLGGGHTFKKSDFSFSNKLVIELHNYATGTSSCSSLQSSLHSSGYNALDTNDSAVKNVIRWS